MCIFGIETRKEEEGIYHLKLKAIIVGYVVRLFSHVFPSFNSSAHD